MLAADWTVLTILVLALVVFFALTFSSSWRTATARRFAKRVGLTLPDAFAPAMGSRLARRVRAGVLGALLGAAGGVALLTLQPTTDVNARIWLILGAYFVGLGIGVAIAALTEHTAVVDGPRVARSDAVALDDYVAPFERNGARVVVVVSVLALIGMLLLPAPGTGTVAPTPLKITLVALGILSLLLFELGSRRIIARSRAAGSPLELAWDDALRAGAARDLVIAPICLGLWSTLLIASDAGQTVPAVQDMRLGIGLIVVALAIIVALIGSAQKPQRYFLRRLWPEMAGAVR